MNTWNKLIDFFLQEKNVEKVLDAVETSFRCIDEYTRSHNYRRYTKMHQREQIAQSKN